MDQIPEQALDWFRAGKGAALATVVETWGSAPRRVGAMLAVSGEGELVGSVSGGCVEGAVYELGQEVLADWLAAGPGRPPTRREVHASPKMLPPPGAPPAYR